MFKNVKGRILIVDDNQLVVRSLIPFLEEDGYKADFAFNGNAAVELALKGNFDLILLDIVLPGMDGFSVLEKLKSQRATANIPVIFISSSDDYSIYRKCFEKGAMDYLKKPVSKAELLFRIHNYLRLGKTEKRLRQSETFFKSIVEDQTEFVIRYNSDGNLIFANSSFCRYFKIRNNDFPGVNFYSLLGLDKDSPLRIDKNETEMEVRTELLCLKNPGAEPVWHEWTARKISDEVSDSVIAQCVGRDITRQKEIDRQILQTIISTEEKERSRFARDLHDDLGPLLSTAKLYLKSIESARDTSHRDTAINQSVKTIDEAILSIKELANNISPHVLRNFGLTSGINSFVNKISETGLINISFNSGIRERLDQNAESSIFRIISELVNNTIKHASATNAFIDINRIENDLILTYSDNGTGFRIEAALKKKMSRGLSNILNRVKLLGGETDMDSAPDKGFNVFIRIPYSGLVSNRDL